MHFPFASTAVAEVGFEQSELEPPAVYRTYVAPEGAAKVLSQTTCVPSAQEDCEQELSVDATKTSGKEVHEEVEEL